MKSLHICVSAFILFLAFNVSAQSKIEVLDSNTFHLGQGVMLSKTSFRGLSVVDDKIIWVSGSKGTIARSIDGGKTFSFQQLIGYKKSDFRDIEAFDKKRAIIMSSGTPAYILKTIDGGQTWKEVYKNTDTAYFLDAMDFWNDKKGMLVGDPINGHFLLLQTNDGGETWQQLDTNKTPKAHLGEAVFAASGTSLRCGFDSIVAFGSGGKVARIFYSNTCGNSWINSSTEIIQGKSSQGIFSIVFENDGKMIRAIGGDYLNDSSKFKSTILFEPSKSKSLVSGDDATNYKSSIEKYYSTHQISCGTKGVDLNEYKKPKYIQISKESFNVVRKAKNGKAVFLAGGKGKIGRLIY